MAIGNHDLPSVGVLRGGDGEGTSGVLTCSCGCWVGGIATCVSMMIVVREVGPRHALLSSTS